MYTQQEAEGKRLKNPCDTITEGIGINRQTQNFSKACIDGAFQGTDREAVEMASVHGPCLEHRQPTCIMHSYLHLQRHTQSSGSVLSHMQCTCPSELHMPNVQKILYHRCQVKCSVCTVTADVGDHVSLVHCMVCANILLWSTFPLLRVHVR